MKKCPYCGTENKDEAFRCKNEDCLSALPQNETNARYTKSPKTTEEVSKVPNGGGGVEKNLRGKITNRKKLIVKWVKANKQLAVAWAMAILICLVFLRGIKCINNSNAFWSTGCFYAALLRALAIVVIGGLIIYTLRDKKK